MIKNILLEVLTGVVAIAATLALVVLLYII